MYLQPALLYPFILQVLIPYPIFGSCIRILQLNYSADESLHTSSKGRRGLTYNTVRMGTQPNNQLTWKANFHCTLKHFFICNF